MPVELKVATAATVCLGPFLDKTDGLTAETGLTTDYLLIWLSKNGGNLTSKADTTDLVHAGGGAAATSLGYYHCVLGTGDTDTLGTLRVMVSDEAVHLPVWQDFEVVTADYWDSKYGAVVLGQAGATAALVAHNLDHLALTATAGTDMTGEVADGTIISRIISSSNTSDFVPATHSLVPLAADVTATHAHAAAADTQTVAATLAASVLDHNVTEHTTASTVGLYVNDVYKGVVTDATGTNVGSDTAEILTRLPDATAGAANGLVICGTNAAITVTSATADALTLTASGANKSGLVINGNGSAAAVDINAGLTGAGIDIAGGGTSGNGITLTATDGDGIEVTGAGSGHVDIDASITDLTTLIATVGTAGVGLTNLGDARVGTTNTAVVTTIPATLAAFATTEDVVHGILDHDRTGHNTTHTVGRALNLLIQRFYHKSVENTGSTSVAYHTEAEVSDGTQAWTEATKTRGTYSGTL